MASTPPRDGGGTKSESIYNLALLQRPTTAFVTHDEAPPEGYKPQAEADVWVADEDEDEDAHNNFASFEEPEGKSPEPLALTPFPKDKMSRSRFDPALGPPSATSLDARDSVNVVHEGLLSSVSATSFDERYPVDNVVTTDRGEFWCSTGMFPQEITLRFDRSVQILSLIIEGSGTRQVTVTQGTSRDAILAVDFATDHPNIQDMDYSQPPTRRAVLYPEGPSGPCDELHLCIESAEEDFCILNFVEVTGRVTDDYDR